MSVSVALRAGEESARAGARPPRGRLFWLRSALGCVAVILGLALLSRERAGDDPAPRPVRPAVLVAPPSPWQPLPAAKRQYAFTTASGQALEKLAQAESGDIALETHGELARLYRPEPRPSSTACA